MPTPLSENVLNVLHSESASSHTQHMTEIRANAANTANVLRSSAVKQFDEPTPAQARAIDKILRLPKLTTG